LGPPFISATVEANNFKFGIQLGLGEELAEKQLSRPKLAGVRARGASKKSLGPPIYFCNFKFCILRQKLAGVWAREH